MKRGSTIAVVAVSTGILAASAIAGVAVVNASNRSPEPATVAVIADPAAVIADAGALPAVSLPTADLPTVTVPPVPTAPRSTAPQAPVTAPADDDDEGYVDEEAGEDDSRAPSAKAEHDDDDHADAEHGDDATAQGDHHEGDDHDEHRDDDD